MSNARLAAKALPMPVPEHEESDLLTIAYMHGYSDGKRDAGLTNNPARLAARERARKQLREWMEKEFGNAVPDKPTCSRGHCEATAFEIALKNSKSGARKVIEKMVRAVQDLHGYRADIDAAIKEGQQWLKENS